MTVYEIYLGEYLKKKICSWSDHRILGTLGDNKEQVHLKFICERRL